MTKKTIKPKGKLVPLYPGSKLLKDEDGVEFNQQGNRRGVVEAKDGRRKRIAQEHNWAKLKVTGAFANIRLTLRQLTPTNDESRAGIRVSLYNCLKDWETLLLQEVEASREQAKKNLKD